MFDILHNCHHIVDIFTIAKMLFILIANIVAEMPCISKKWNIQDNIKHPLLSIQDYRLFEMNDRH